MTSRLMILTAGVTISQACSSSSPADDMYDARQSAKDGWSQSQSVESLDQTPIFVAAEIQSFREWYALEVDKVWVTARTSKVRRLDQAAWETVDLGSVVSEDDIVKVTSSYLQSICTNLDKLNIGPSLEEFNKLDATARNRLTDAKLNSNGEAECRIDGNDVENLNQEFDWLQVGIPVKPRRALSVRHADWTGHFKPNADGNWHEFKGRASCLDAEGKILKTYPLLFTDLPRPGEDTTAWMTGLTTEAYFDCHSIIVGADTTPLNIGEVTSRPSTPTNVVYGDVDGNTEFHGKNGVMHFSSVVCGQTHTCNDRVDLAGTSQEAVTIDPVGPGSTHCLYDLYTLAPNTYRMGLRDCSSRDYIGSQCGSMEFTTDAEWKTLKVTEWDPPYDGVEPANCPEPMVFSAIEPGN